MLSLYGFTWRAMHDQRSCDVSEVSLETADNRHVFKRVRE